MKKRNNGKRNVQFFAAAALAAALAAGQIQPMAVMGAGDTIQVSSLIPDNVTVEQPVPLSEIRLPSSDYELCPGQTVPVYPQKGYRLMM